MAVFFATRIRNSMLVRVPQLPEQQVDGLLVVQSAEHAPKPLSPHTVGRHE
jgi:hypothetical protein